MFNETMRRSFLPIAFLILFAPALPAQTSTSGDIVGNHNGSFRGNDAGGDHPVEEQRDRRSAAENAAVPRAHIAFPFCRRAPTR